MVAIPARPMQQHFRIGYAIPAADAILIFRRLGRRRIFQTFDRSTFIANEMRMFMTGLADRAKSIAPNQIIAAHAMDQSLIGEGEEGSIKGDVVGSFGEFIEYLRSAKGLPLLGEDGQDPDADGCPAKARLAEQVDRFFERFAHARIIAFTYRQCVRGNYRTWRMKQSIHAKSRNLLAAIFRVYSRLRPK
jgi:hypothetical protein